MIQKFGIFLAVAAFSSWASADTVHVYLLAGQSNMQGIALIKDLKPEQKKIPSQTYFWNGKSFEPLVVGKTKTSTRSGEFGPEIGFSQEIRKSSENCYIIKFHASGMPLFYGWDGNKWMGDDKAPHRTNFYPGEKAKDPNQGKLYKKMIQRFKAGIKALKKEGHTPVIDGFVWMQGEQDSKHEISATHYAAALKQLKLRVGEDLNVKQLPMSFGQVLPYTPALARFTHRKEIRQQMADADMNSGKPEAIPQTRMVSTDGFPQRRDHVHYNAEGQMMLGKQLAKALTEAKRGSR